MTPDSVALGVALVVFGATGDLAHRKLYPALSSLASRDQLPSRLVVIGVARRDGSDEEYVEQVRKSVANAGGDAEAMPNRGVHFRYVQGSVDDDATFAALRDVIEDCDHKHGTQGNRLFYLSTVPTAFPKVAAGLGRVGLARELAGSFCRVVVEKPFGRDLASAVALDDALHEHFREHQIFRIDHYLAKETVQNIMALRFTNTIFEPIWNRRYVDHVQITVAEDIGVAHRGDFYEQSGAIRDIVQNHLLQVLSVTAMEPPPSFDADRIRDEKVKVLRSIRPLDPAAMKGNVVRGQYTRGTIGGEEVPGYRESEGVSPTSNVETYIAARIEIENWRWSGVPFYIRTGKALAQRATEVVLRYRPVPFLPLPESAADTVKPNTLLLRIQPDEGIELHFAAKVPGSTLQVRSTTLNFRYDSFAEQTPDAYERVFLDALLGDATLFIRSDEVELAWRVVQPLLDAFARDLVPLCTYPAGSWGPLEADALLVPEDDHWHQPS
jgi:glucose-6-phosphate 1-dehydrogenase